MDPHKSVGSNYSVHGPQKYSTVVDLGSGTHNALEKNPSYESETHFEPKITWKEKLGQGLKITGMVVGAVVTGALALGLLPLTIIGGVIYLSGLAGDMSHMDDQDVVDGTASKEKMQSIERAQQTGAVLQTAGVILALPAVGFMSCLNSIENVAKDGDLFDIKRRMSSTLSDIKKQSPNVSEKSMNELKDTRWSSFENDVKHLSKLKLKKLYIYVEGLNESNCHNIGADEKKRALDYMKARITKS